MEEIRSHMSNVLKDPPCIEFISLIKYQCKIYVKNVLGVDLAVKYEAYFDDCDSFPHKYNTRHNNEFLSAIAPKVITFTELL